MVRAWRGSDVTSVDVRAVGVRQAKWLLANDWVAVDDRGVGIVWWILRDFEGQPGAAWPWPQVARGSGPSSRPLKASMEPDPDERHFSETVVRRARTGEARAWLERHMAGINDWSTTGCVFWPFSTNGGSGGQYPQVNIDGRVLGVTRYIFEQLAGRPLAGGEVIRHSCDEPRCVNGWHFSTGSQFDNVQDMLQRQRQASGERNGRSQLTEEQVRDIRALAREHDLRGEVAFVARGYGVSPAALALVLKGETWRGVA
jgi:hypothetical protein